jgi:hypothetical protein
MSVRVGRGETIIGALILATLCAIGVAVFLRQFSFDPALFTPPGPAEPAASAAPPGGPSAGEFPVELPQGFEPSSPPEVFGPENLSDKIDGKAELYLSAGFATLRTLRFAPATRPEEWAEIYVYDMGNGHNAFSVYSAQQRSGAEPLDVARFAYRTENALFFVHGREYVEIISASPSPQLQAGMLQLATSLIENSPAADAELAELSLFPPQDRDDDSVALLTADAFGFDQLDNVWTSRYSIEGAALTAFLSLRASDEEATALAAAYLQFLLENGGQRLDVATNIPGMQVLELFGVYELVFAHDRWLAGVHEAESRPAAVELAHRLHQELAGASP